MNEPVPCRVCHKAHQWTDEHGWRADNGYGWHAYDRRPAEYVQGEPITIGEPDLSGWERTNFGAQVRCPWCHGNFDPDAAEGHQKRELDIDEALGIAWKALNGGAGNRRNSDAREAG